MQGVRRYLHLHKRQQLPKVAAVGGRDRSSPAHLRPVGGNEKGNRQEGQGLDVLDELACSLH